MKHYVLGFLFNVDHSCVLLCEKNAPDWQKGKWNGIGGKVEPGEGLYESMRREGREEAGIEVNWKWIGEMRCPNEWAVAVFAGSTLQVVNAATDVGEELRWFALHMVPANSIDNLKWIIPFALHHFRQRAQFEVRYPLEWTEKTITAEANTM